MTSRLLAVLAACLVHLSASAGEVRFTEVSYSGDDGGPVPAAAEFRNPVVAGFHPDPSVIRVGDDFYLVNSTFGYFPGLPVFHSRDLVSWTQIGNAIDRPGQIDYGDNDELTRGLFAATISHHAGTFYIANTCFYCDGGNFVVTATDPAGPWSDPVWLGFSGIDPSLFFDDDGRAWMVNNDVPDGPLRYDGHRAIWLQEFDPATKTMTGPRTVLVDGGADPASSPEHIEGPHLFRHDGWYYLTAAEGGTGEQHAQMVWRSRAVTGPYQAWAGNPTLTQRDLDPARADPVTSAGHAQFVRLQDGSWWSVFLATRPYRGNQYNLGRETFLLPVTWQDGWPRILARGEPVPAVLPRPALPTGTAALPTSGPIRWTERFQGERLPLQWMTIHPPKQPWYRTSRDGLHVAPTSTRLHQHADGHSGQPAYLAHRLQHHRATFSTTIAAWTPADGEFAGLALIQNERHHYVAGITRDAQGLALVVDRRAGGEGERVARVPLASTEAPVSLRFELDAPRLHVSYALQPGHWQPLARDLDASLLTPDVAGGFIGNTFGPYAYRPGG